MVDSQLKFQSTVRLGPFKQICGFENYRGSKRSQLEHYQCDSHDQLNVARDKDIQKMDCTKLNSCLLNVGLRNQLDLVFLNPLLFLVCVFLITKQMLVMYLSALIMFAPLKKAIFRPIRGCINKLPLTSINICVMS